MGSPKCKGRCAKGKDGKCDEALTFQWSIVPGPGTKATITAGATEEKVTIKWTSNGNVDITVDITLQCKCGDQNSGAAVKAQGKTTSNVNVFA